MTKYIETATIVPVEDYSRDLWITKFKNPEEGWHEMEYLMSHKWARILAADESHYMIIPPDNFHVCMTAKPIDEDDLDDTIRWMLHYSVNYFIDKSHRYSFIDYSPSIEYIPSKYHMTSIRRIVAIFRNKYRDLRGCGSFVEA